MNVRTWAGLATAGLILAGSPSAAQESGSSGVGAIAGFVRDAITDRPLTPANVIVVDTGWGGWSSAEGEFLIRNLPAGRYSLLVKMMGYESLELADVEVHSGETAFLRARLQPAVVMIVPPVCVKPPAVLREDASLKPPPVPLEMPIDDPQDLLKMVVGFVGSGDDLHAHGGRSGEILTMIDGIPVRDPWGGRQDFLGLSALQDMEVLTGSFAPKYGNLQSGVILYRTKEGSEQFGGEIRYITDDYGSPNNTYDNYDRVLLGLGGPLPVRDLTYYISAEATYQDPYPKT
ncbi:MAG: TonB-dependent receptor, partial [Candidatus Eisenbacteria bacterium]